VTAGHRGVGEFVAPGKCDGGAYPAAGFQFHSLRTSAAQVLSLPSDQGRSRWLAPRPGSSIGSLAVLPFANVTADPNSDYLSDGLTESLISSLSQLPNLTVRPRSAVFRYKSKDVDPQKAASELKVGAVVTGRVTQRGDSLLVSAALTDIRTNRSLWSEQYDRKISDALSVHEKFPHVWMVAHRT
jgi:TolB-like protein